MATFWKNADEDARLHAIIFGALGLVALVSVSGVVWHKRHASAHGYTALAKPVIVATVQSRLRVDLTPKTATLTGTVLSEAQKAAILGRAKAAYPTLAVVDQIRVAQSGGIPFDESAARWVRPTLSVMDASSTLRWGSFTADNESLTLRGDVTTEEGATALKTKLAALKANGMVVEIPDLKVLAAPAIEPEVLKANILKHLDGKVVAFEPGSEKLTAQGKAVLDELAPDLKDLTGLRVEVAGHTDNAGDPAKNKELSTKRAETVVAYLATKGVDKTHLDPKGFGDTQPKASNDTDAGKQQNRRIDFTPDEVH